MGWLMDVLGTDRGAWWLWLWLCVALVSSVTAVAAAAAAAAAAGALCGSIKSPAFSDTAGLVVICGGSESAEDIILYNI